VLHWFDKLRHWFRIVNTWSRVLMPRINFSAVWCAGGQPALCCSGPVSWCGEPQRELGQKLSFRPADESDVGDKSSWNTTPHCFASYSAQHTVGCWGNVQYDLAVEGGRRYTSDVPLLITVVFVICSCCNWWTAGCCQHASGKTLYLCSISVLVNTGVEYGGGWWFLIIVI